MVLRVPPLPLNLPTSLENRFHRAVTKALETEEQPNASMLRTCLEVLKANDVDVNALEEKIHQPGHSLAGIKLPFDAEGNRVN